MVPVASSTTRNSTEYCGLADTAGWVDEEAADCDRDFA